MSVDKAVESGELQRVINGMDIAGIHPSLKLLCDAARSYVRMVEEGPDYVAATEEADRLLGKLTAHYADVVAIVDAALVVPLSTTEEK